jgi:hypothetical protein
MSRSIKIEKIGKSTIIEVVNEGQQTPEVHVINKLTNLTLRNDVIEIKTDNDFILFIQYDEIFNKLASTDIKDYLHKAAAIFLFNQ